VSSRDSSDSPGADASFASAKRLFVMAAVGIACGLAVAGTFDRSAGGVILLAAWLVAVVALHRLGRAGSERRGAG
jgi:hypothetical protein